VTTGWDFSTTVGNEKTKRHSTKKGGARMPQGMEYTPPHERAARKLAQQGEHRQREREHAAQLVEMYGKDGAAHFIYTEELRRHNAESEMVRQSSGALPRRVRSLRPTRADVQAVRELPDI
jgi:hypothetical protein